MYKYIFNWMKWVLNVRYAIKNLIPSFSLFLSFDYIPFIHSNRIVLIVVYALTVAKTRSNSNWISIRNLRYGILNKCVRVCMCLRSHNIFLFIFYFNANKSSIHLTNEESDEVEQNVRKIKQIFLDQKSINETIADRFGLFRLE